MYRGLPDKSIAQVGKCGNCGEHGQQRFYRRTAPQSRIMQASRSWELARIHRTAQTQRADTVVHRTTLFALTPTASVLASTGAVGLPPEQSPGGHANSGVKGT